MKIFISYADGVRVLRGGAWHLSQYFVRAVYRYYGLPGDQVNLIGFRIVRPLSP
ncbi:MAG: hypothetical protein JXJ20_11050 [Anaerolineae bacterium]|nr:hypothetical protein [Anaerolineae bacterium]